MDYIGMETSSFLDAPASPRLYCLNSGYMKNNFLLKDLQPDFTDVEKNNRCHISLTIEMLKKDNLYTAIAWRDSC